MVRMGKKASRKICLDYDLDETQGYFDHTGDEFEYDQRGNTNISRQSRNTGGANKNKAVRVAASKLCGRTVGDGCSSHSVTADTEEGMGSGIAINVMTFKRYHRRQIGRPFSTLLLDRGHESVLLHTASFLDLRSISAWSCVNRALEAILANPALYCRSQSTLLLPCMKGAPLPASNTLRSRALALQSTQFRKGGSSKPRERSLKRVFSVPFTPGTFLESKLSMCGSTITCMTSDGEIVRYRVSSDDFMANYNNLQLTRRTSYRKRFLRKECLGDIICSFSSSQYGALLTIPSTGLRKYVLSVTSMRFISKHSKGIEDNVAWQCDIEPSIPESACGKAFSLALCSNITSRLSCIKIDYPNGRLMVAFKNCFMVFSLIDGRLLWQLALCKEQQDWITWVLQGHYVVAMTANQKRVIIICLESQCVAASGCIPVKRGGRTVSSLQKSSTPALTVHGERVWFTKQGTLYCTGLIIRRLDRRKHVAQTLQQLRINQFHAVEELKHSRNNILKEFEGTLYFTDGNLIKLFKEDTHVVDNVKSSTRHNLITGPSQVLCADGTITFLRVDSTKIVCGITDDKKNRIEIFLHPDVAAEPTSFYRSVFIKNANVFCNRYDLRSVDIKGGKLLVEFAKIPDCAYAIGGQRLQKSELRIYDLFEWDEFS